MDKQNGGPAFPRPATAEIQQDVGTPHERIIRERDDGAEGMSLRDWFAGRLIPHILNGSLEVIKAGGTAQSQDSLAKDAYTLADAMLRERAKAR